MKLRLTAISDTHNKHKQLNGKLPGGDLLIHSGDFTSIGRKHEVEDFIKWFSAQPYKFKVFIAGNHDLTFDNEVLFRDKSVHFDKKQYFEPPVNGKPNWLIEMLSKLDNDTFYLENSFVEFDNIKIWGSPISPSFGYGWAFNKDRGKTQNNYQNVGCEDLYHRLQEVKPHLHFAGHIHEAYGYGIIPYKDEWGDIYTFNGCSCNLRYEVYNEPITFDYDFISRQINFI